MIATLSGKISEKLLDQLVVNVNGVGYGVYVTSEDYGRLNIGESSKVYIYEHVREQSHDLFGFLEIDTKYLFEKLLAVNGIGPKMAINMLSIGSPSSVKQAIAEGNVKFIQQANGVGKRVAERVIVDLKDKVGLIGVDIEASGLLKSNLIQDEATEALMALGFSSNDAQVALNEVDTNLPTEDRVKQALKGAK